MKQLNSQSFPPQTNKKQKPARATPKSSFSRASREMGMIYRTGDVSRMNFFQKPLGQFNMDLVQMIMVRKGILTPLEAAKLLARLI